jgi:hypothetical protein
LATARSLQVRQGFNGKLLDGALTNAAH